MGVHPNIGYNKWPKQSDKLCKPVAVCFNYNTNERLKGEIVRDDTEAPFIMIIKLECGRLVLATECQYQYVNKS